MFSDADEVAVAHVLRGHELDCVREWHGFLAVEGQEDPPRHVCIGHRLRLGLTDVPCTSGPGEADGSWIQSTSPSDDDGVSAGCRPGLVPVGIVRH